MTPYGKTAQAALASISRLAELYDPKNPERLSSQQIAEQRGLGKPLVAKVLTVLSSAGLLSGSPGPRGGYALAKPPAHITLYDVVSLFDRLDESLGCPFGPNYCGNGPRCPLHDSLESFRAALKDFLLETRLDAFLPKKANRTTK